ncbi:MAG: dihydroorotase [Variovorax sp.]
MSENILVTGGRIVDPSSGTDRRADLALADGKVLAIGDVPCDFRADHTLDAEGCLVVPGPVDLAARLREPGYEHEGMLESELAAAVAGGVTSLVCPPDTDPVLDEPGLVEMLKFRAEKMRRARLYPLGALTLGLAGEVLTEMAALTEAGCIGFSQADVPLGSTQVLQRALLYASTFGYTVWLRPQDRDLGRGVAASGPLATRLGLAGIPPAAETIAVFTIIELMRSTGARVHLCRLSSAGGVAQVRAAKAEGLPLTCDVSINSLLLADTDIGYFDSRAARSAAAPAARPRCAVGGAGRRHHRCAGVRPRRSRPMPRRCLAESEPGAGLEPLLLLALQWGEQSGAGLLRAIEAVARRRGGSSARPTPDASPGPRRRHLRVRPGNGVAGTARRTAEPGQAHALRRLRVARAGGFTLVDGRKVHG